MKDEGYGFVEFGQPADGEPLPMNVYRVTFMEVGGQRFGAQIRANSMEELRSMLREQFDDADELKVELVEGAN
ncbi:MAG: hypothetical protein AAGH15_05235 [Myxococcota bacterium]